LRQLSTHISSGPVILEGWQLDPDLVTSLTHPQLRACWLLVDDAVLEARLRADTAFYQGPARSSG
jgi:hypothetical protein